MPLTTEWAVTLFASYDQFSRSLQNSSFIEALGRGNQWSVGLGIGYRFGWNESP